MDRETTEALWREACWEFLDACFERATPGVINALANAVFHYQHVARAAGIELGAVTGAVVEQ